MEDPIAQKGRLVNKSLWELSFQKEIIEDEVKSESTVGHGRIQEAIPLPTKERIVDGDDNEKLSNDNENISGGVISKPRGAMQLINKTTVTDAEKVKDIKPEVAQ